MKTYSHNNQKNGMKMGNFNKTTLMLAMLTAISSPQLLAAEKTEVEEVERIMVTGSRIARTELASSSPITVVSKESMVNMGITDVSSALRRLPALTGNTANNQSSSGANNIQTATLRGIEATNTLVLVNGRRIVGSDANGLVDLSSIPFEAIQEMQVLKDGASAIYGSDAIAGVVNIITRKSFDGFDVNSHYGVSSEGDAQERKVGLVVGTSTDKASIMIAASISNNSGWEEKDRYMTRDANQEYLGGSNGNSGTAPQANLSGFGLGEGAWTVRDANNPTEVTPWVYAEDGYNYRDAQSGANDNKTTSIFITGDYQLTDDTKFFAEISSHDGFVQGNQAPPGTSTSYYGDNIDTPNAFQRYNDEAGNTFGVGANQKYNPFGEVGNVSRRFSEYGSRIYKSQNNILRYTMGLQGVMADDYDWEIIYSSQDAKLVQEGGPQPSLIQIERALSDECETEADPNCVALNVFGPEGTITTEMLDFINTTAPSTTNKNKLSYIQASITGPVMSLPAGDMMFAFGAEHREDQLSLEADISQRTATFDVSWGGTTTPVISPKRKTDEAYLELVVPVLDNLDFEAAVRYTEYSDIDQSTTNPKFGIKYAPLDILKLRASYSTGFRAPTMAEMYQGRTSTIQTNLYDPCNMDNDNVVDNVPGCEGLLDSEIKNEIRSYDQIGGGNADLEPEEAKNATLGLVLEPMDDLALTFDYFKIEQTNVVFGSAEYVIDQYVAGNPDYANDVIRSANGKGYIATVISPANNIAERHVSGYDFNVNYIIASSVGEFRVNLDATVVDTFDVQDVDGDPFRDLVGSYDATFGSIPKTKLNVQLDWSMDNLRVTYDTTYNSKIAADETDVMDSTLFHNIQMGYYIEEYKMDLNFGIQNLFDKAPPFLMANGSSTDDNLYSFRGRFMYGGVAVSF